MIKRGHNGLYLCDPRLVFVCLARLVPCIDVVFKCSLRTQIREFRRSVDIVKVPVKS